MNGAPSSKNPAQRERILALLRARGSAGCTNVELNAICFRYGGRIFELRGAGYEIKTIREGESLFRFVLTAEPEKRENLSGFMEQRRREADEAMPLFAGGAA
ncbi:MAG TPA: helix-turn-helix domain-containing protein [Candidatus Acidoferrales bacterium]|nr:helix-turn-helix domain-containing protein [Candidatus Acidoferrales bacterium]